MSKELTTPASFLKRELAKKLTKKQMDEFNSLFEVAEQIHREQLIVAFDLGIKEGQTKDEILDIFQSADQIIRVDDLDELFNDIIKGGDKCK
jgi:hypothetical protein